MKNTKGGIGLIVTIVIIAVIAAIIGTILLVVTSNSTNTSTDNNIKDETSSNVGDLEESTTNSKIISYNNFKIKVGQGNFVGLGTTVKEFVEQTGMNILDRYSDFDENATYGKGAWDDANIRYEGRIIGDARIRNSHDEPKNYKDCVLVYFGFEYLTEDIKLYYNSKEISTRSEVVSLFGEPYKQMTNILENAYAYKVSQTDFAPNMDLQIKFDFDENDDKIEKIYVGFR